MWVLVGDSEEIVLFCWQQCEMSGVYCLFLEVWFLRSDLLSSILVFLVVHHIIFYFQIFKTFDIGGRCVEVNGSHDWIFEDEFSFFFGNQTILGDQTILKINYWCSDWICDRVGSSFISILWFNYNMQMNKTRQSKRAHMWSTQCFLFRGQVFGWDGDMNILAALLVGLSNIHFLKIMHCYSDISCENLYINDNLFVFRASKRILVLFMCCQRVTEDAVGW